MPDSRSDACPLALTLAVTALLASAVGATNIHLGSSPPTAKPTPLAWPAAPDPEIRSLQRSDDPDKIVNGLLSWNHPSVGWHYAAGGTCTGTLIGCSTVLTAAHCVVSDSDPTHHLFFLQNNGLYSVASIAVHPAYTGAVDSPHDLAILRLSVPVVGIQPSAINTVSKPPFGTPGEIVGFGRVGDPFQATGIKRAGLVTTSSCGGGQDATHICWNFASPQGPPGSNSSTCNGDSGGPLFADPGSGPLVVGTTSYGNQSCLPPNLARDADVYLDRAWIQNAATGGLGQSSCGTLPSAGTSGAPYLFGFGTLSAGNPDDEFSFQVPSGTQALLVTLNHETGADLDLYVNPASPAVPGSAACAGEQFAPFPEVCFFSSPAPGTWYLRGQRFSGAAPYQVTVTLFGSQGGSACVPDANTLCLDDQPGDRRFEAKMTWNRTGAFGQAGAVPLNVVGVNRGGLFWIGNSSNPEVLIKVINGCPLTGHYWVFYSAGTNQGIDLTVRDTVTGEVWTGSNPNGTLAPPVADTAAIACQ